MRWGPLSEGPQGGWGGASFSLAAPAPSPRVPATGLPGGTVGGSGFQRCSLPPLRCHAQGYPVRSPFSGMSAQPQRAGQPALADEGKETQEEVPWAAPLARLSLCYMGLVQEGRRAPVLPPQVAPSFKAEGPRCPSLAGDSLPLPANARARPELTAHPGRSTDSHLLSSCRLECPAQPPDISGHHGSISGFHTSFLFPAGPALAGLGSKDHGGWLGTARR